MAEPKDNFYSRCLVQGKACLFKVDERSNANFVSSRTVKALNLYTFPHLFPYKMKTLHGVAETSVNKQAIIEFSLGKYRDLILCDIIPMETAHMVFGKPWIHAKSARFKKNAYSLVHNEKEIRLIAMSLDEIKVDQERLREKIREEEKKRKIKEKEKEEENNQEREKKLFMSENENEHFCLNSNENHISSSMVEFSLQVECLNEVSKELPSKLEERSSEVMMYKSFKAELPQMDIVLLICPIDNPTLVTFQTFTSCSLNDRMISSCLQSEMAFKSEAFNVETNDSFLSPKFDAYAFPAIALKNHCCYGPFLNCVNQVNVCVSNVRKDQNYDISAFMKPGWDNCFKPMLFCLWNKYVDYYHLTCVWRNFQFALVSLREYFDFYHLLSILNAKLVEDIGLREVIWTYELKHMEKMTTRFKF